MPTSHQRPFRLRTSSSSSHRCLLNPFTSPNTCSVTGFCIRPPVSSSSGAPPKTCFSDAPAHSVVESLLQSQLYFYPTMPPATTPKSFSTSFSNGECHQTRNLPLAYIKTISCPYPPHITSFDSCPGHVTFKRSVLALSSALPFFHRHASSSSF